MHKVAVITRTRSRPRMLDRALKSVLNQRMKDFIWVVVNDGGEQTHVNRVVDRAKASHEGFAYSDGMKARSAEKWTYENLDAFLKDPKTATPKTKMVYAGVKRDQARADIIAYLASLSDAPKPFPAP